MTGPAEGRLRTVSPLIVGAGHGAGWMKLVLSGA